MSDQGSIPGMEEKPKTFRQTLIDFLDKHPIQVTDLAIYLGKPRSTVGGWRGKNHEDGSPVEPNEEVKREVLQKLADFNPESFRSVVQHRPIVIVAAKADDVFAFSLLEEKLAVTRFELVRLLPMLQSFVNGSQEHRVALRNHLGEMFDEFLNLVRALTSESARDRVIAEGLIPSRSHKIKVRG